MELNREFDERFHSDEFDLLDRLNQRYREEIGNIHVFERISTKRKWFLWRKKNEFTTDGRDVSALGSL